jgi:hypothetical protein
VEAKGLPVMQPDTLYCGDEAKVVDCAWMQAQGRRVPNWPEFMRKSGKQPLMNAGVVGGPASKLITLAEDIVKIGGPLTDMPAFNMAISYFKREYGRHITSIFKAEDNNFKGWWKHK